MEMVFAAYKGEDCVAVCAKPDGKELTWKEVSADLRDFERRGYVVREVSRDDAIKQLQNYMARKGMK